MLSRSQRIVAVFLCSHSHAHTNKCMYSGGGDGDVSSVCRSLACLLQQKSSCFCALALLLFCLRRSCALCDVFFFSLSPPRKVQQLCVCVSLDYVTHSQCSKRRIYCVRACARQQRSQQQKQRVLLNYLLFPVIYCLLCVCVRGLFLFEVTSQRGRRRAN